MILRSRPTRFLPALTLAAMAGLLGRGPTAAQPAAPAAPAAPAEEISRAELLSAAAEAVNSDQPAWTLSFDLRRLMSSPLAQSLSSAMEEAGGTDHLAEFEQKSGLNLREDVGAVVFTGEDFQDEAGALVAELAGSAGKLEQWFADQPEHAVETLPDGTKLHTFRMKDQTPAAGGVGGSESAGGTTVWTALRQTDGGTRLISATDEASARRLAVADDLEERLAPGRLGGEEVFRFRAPDLPADLAPAGMMGGELVGAVRGLTLTLDSGEAVRMDLRLDTANDSEAVKLQGALQVYAGMIPMAASTMGLSQEQGQQLFEMVQQLDIAAEAGEGGASPGVRVRLGVPQEVIDGAIAGAREAADASAEQGSPEATD